MERNSIKILIGPELIIRFNVIFKKIQTSFFKEFDKLFVKCIRKRELRISKTLFKKQQKKERHQISRPIIKK